MRPALLLTSSFKKKRWAPASLFFIFLLTCFSFSTNAADVTISSATSFTTLDAGDGATDGVFTVTGNLTITSTGSITGPGGSSGININISGNLIMEVGAKITGNSTNTSTSGIPITIVTGGSILLHGSGLTGASITSNTPVGGSCNGGKGGNISLTSGTDFTTESGSVISANATCSAGQIFIQALSGNVTIDGLVESYSSLTGTGAHQAPGGGTITIKASCSLTIANNGKVSSRGLDPGADLVHLDGCSVNIFGLVESTGHGHAIPNFPHNQLYLTRPDKGLNATAGIEIWGNTITINAIAPHNGEVNADLTIGAAGRSWIDVLARNAITILGDAGNFAVHANNGGNNNVGGTITVISQEGTSAASGNAFQANGAFGGSGGEIDLAAYLDEDISGSATEAKGASHDGGTVNVQSYNGDILSNAGTTINVSRGASNFALGTVTLTECGTAAWNGTVTGGATPTPTTGTCISAPDLASYVVLPPASCVNNCTPNNGCEGVTVADAGPDTTFCETTSVTLNGNLPIIGTGTWTLESGAGDITDIHSPTTTVTNLGYGDNVFKWTITYNECTPTDDEVTITRLHAPTAYAGPDQSLCNVTSVTLAGNDPSPGTGTWSKVSGTGGTITTPSLYNTTVTGLTPGVYVFKWKVSNGVCSDSDNVQITIYAKITANAGPDQDLCNLTSATLAGNNPSPGTGTWSQISGAAATITDLHLRNTTVTGLTLGTYVFQWKITNGECVDSDQVQIKIENCVCLGGGGGLTLGFWSNKNGQALETSSDFCTLNAYCLVNGVGTDFNPGTYCPATTNQLRAEKTAFAAWLLNGNSVSMAYMLSVQLSAMKLNVLHGFVNGGALVYAPGAGNTGLGNNYITINDLMASANTQLCNDGYTPSGDPNRALQEAIKTALDNANNNKNFVQSTCSGAVNSNTIVSFARTSSVMSAGELALKASPNPTNSQFTLKIQSNNRKDAISIRIVDMYGRVVETFTKLSAGQTLQLGSKYISGIYIAELIQGKNHQQVKLVKQ